MYIHMPNISTRTFMIYTWLRLSDVLLAARLDDHEVAKSGDTAGTVLVEVQDFPGWWNTSGEEIDIYI